MSASGVLVSHRAAGTEHVLGPQGAAASVFSVNYDWEQNRWSWERPGSGCVMDLLGCRTKARLECMFVLGALPYIQSLGSPAVERVNYWILGINF